MSPLEAVGGAVKFEEHDDLLTRLDLSSINFADLSKNKFLDRSLLSKNQKKFVEQWENAIEDEDEDYCALPRNKDDIMLITLLNSSYTNIINENSLKQLNYNLKPVTEKEDYKIKFVTPSHNMV